MVNRFFLDTSALLKRYKSELGSAWVKTLTNPATGYEIILSEITLAEGAAAFAALHRAPAGITQQERDDAIALLLKHCQVEYDLIAVSRPIIDRAVSLTQNHRLRGCDAIQLATALVTNAAFGAAGAALLTFVAADDDLLIAARTEGLVADNPNLHP